MPEWAFLITIGIILVILGFLLVTFGIMRSVQEEQAEEPPYEIKEKSVKGTGVILIGPVPIVFGSDKKSALILIVLAIVLMLLMIIFLK
ncbi:MAG TPA: TIGR00304 family protein [Candidatus Methanoperedens sp.]